MNIDTDKIDDTVLALLTLTICDENQFGARAWKGHDWDVLARLHEKGMIHDPVGKLKSVAFTEEGLARSRKLFSEMFTQDQAE